MNPFSLQIGDKVERQLGRCRVSIRELIRTRLQTIVEEFSRPAGRTRSAEVTGPPLRFYVWEGYRISYQVNPVTRRVVVLDLRPEHG